MSRSVLVGVVVLHAAIIVVGVVILRQWPSWYDLLVIEHASAFWVVNAGALLGHAVIALSWEDDQRSSAVVEAGRRQDLLDNRGLVVEQLRALELEKDKLSPADYQRERDALLAVGAQAARELAEGPGGTLVRGDDTDPDAAAEAATVVSGIAPPDVGAGGDTVVATTPGTSVRAGDLTGTLRQLRDADPDAFRASLSDLGEAGAAGTARWQGAIAATVILAVVGGFAWAVSQDARPRGTGMSMTGGDQVTESNDRSRETLGAPPAAAPVFGDDPRVQALRARLTGTDGDLAVHNELTQLAIAKEDLGAALAANESALAIDPDDIDAVTFRGVLQLLINRRDEGYRTLDGLITAHPDAVLPRIYRGLLSLEHDPERALEVLEEAASLSDDPRIAGLLERARQEVARQQAAPGAPGLEAGTPSRPGMAAGTPDGAPPAAGAEVVLSGTIDLAEGVIAEGQVLYLNVRGPTMPMPFLVKRLPPGPFPMDFTLTSADRMPATASLPLPTELTLGARLDSDGDAFSKPPTDPAALVPGLSQGTTGLTLTLDVAGN